MGWWTRKREERQASIVAAMATAFATALGGVLTAQTEGIKQQGQFLGTLQDLSARKAAQVLGSKGGRTTAARKAKALRKDPEKPYCALCENPMRRGVTLEMLAFHRLHGDNPDQPAQEPAARAQLEPPANGNGSH